MNISQIKAGDSVSWIYTPRGGYGYSYPVDAIVLKVGKSKIQIRVSKKDGELVTRWVCPSKLQPRVFKGNS